MIKQKFKILFFLPFLISLSSFAENYPSRILFVGNSYLYYNDSIHNHVEKMLIEFYGDEEITTKSATIGGSRLHNHNIDHLLEPKNLQLDQQIDLLIMQGGSGEVLTKKSRKNFEDTSYSYSIKAHEKGIKTALYMKNVNPLKYVPIASILIPLFIMVISMNLYLLCYMNHGIILPLVNSVALNIKNTRF